MCQHQDCRAWQVVSAPHVSRVVSLSTCLTADHGSFLNRSRPRRSTRRQLFNRSWRREVTCTWSPAPQVPDASLHSEATNSARWPPDRIGALVAGLLCVANTCPTFAAMLSAFQVLQERLLSGLFTCHHLKSCAVQWPSQQEATATVVTSSTALLLESGHCRTRPRRPACSARGPAASWKAARSWITTRGA